MNNLKTTNKGVIIAVVFLSQALLLTLYFTGFPTIDYNFDFSETEIVQTNHFNNKTDHPRVDYNQTKTTQPKDPAEDSNKKTDDPKVDYNQTKTTQPKDPAEDSNNFFNALQKLDWKEYIRLGNIGVDTPEFLDIRRKHQNILLEYVIKEPSVSIDKSCGPPPLPKVTPVMCKNAGSGNVFKEQLREKPAKVMHAIPLGFDIDTLEIHLNEIYDIVDHFVIIESNTMHLKGRKKPLMWDQVRHQERFKKFDSKVLYFVLDGAQTGESPKMFQLESNQEQMRWTKFLEWNKISKFYNDNDIVGFGDADEISNRENLHLLKYCEPNEMPVDVGILFTRGTILKAFTSDYPVSHQYRYSLGDPTYYTLKIAKQRRPYPTRNRGRSPSYLLGGNHLSDYAYVPYLHLKKISCSECFFKDFGWERVENIMKTGNRMTLMDDALSMFSKRRPKNEGWFHRLVDIEKLDSNNKELIKTPWLLKCNPNRYPSWIGKYDTRI